MSPDGTDPPRSRVLVLDSLRGVAIILVVASHAFWRQFTMGGPVGVAVFFALSGYLITGLLLGEHDRTGRIALPGFYLRRARRLLPALFVFLSTMVLLGLWLGPAFATWQDTVPTVLYVQNYAHFEPTLSHTLGHTWSLSVEEQFYIIFPILLIGLLRVAPRPLLIRTLVGLAVAFLALRVVLWATGSTFERVYYGTDANAGLILLGAAAAAWVSVHRTVRRDLLVLVPFSLPVLVLLGYVADRESARAIVPELAALVTVCVLLVVAGRDVPAWFAPGWLVLVGQRSYGLYLWHYPLFHVLQPRLPQGLLSSVVLLVAAWVLTLLSWHFVEGPVLSWKPSRRQVREPMVVSAHPLG